MFIHYRLIATLMVVLTLAAGCAGAEPVLPSPTPLPPTATPMPPTATVTLSPTNTSVPLTPTPGPTDTPTPTPSPTPIPISTRIAEALEGLPAATPGPATHTVCAAGCDFTTIQVAIDDPGTSSGAVIEITDPIHTEAGIVVNKNVTIQGLGADRLQASYGKTIVQAHEAPDKAPERVFLIERGASVVFRNMTIRHGKPSIGDEHGGGIMNYGTLTLDRCDVRDNVADGGGGISTNGVLTLINTSVRDNTAEGVARPPGVPCGGGGGIKCESGTLTLINSILSGNQAGIRDRGWGGGAHIACNCTATFINSTISGNKSASDSGGARVRGSLQLANCTISNNTASGKGGGLNVVGRLDYVNTIIANNIGKQGDCVVGSSYGFTFQGEGSIGANSNNLVGSGNCEPDYSDDPLLGPLANNGGDTLTRALLPGSPAIDAIPAISCTLPTDQRGMPRPVMQTSSDTPCDIGAFEVQAATASE